MSLQVALQKSTWTCVVVQITFLYISLPCLEFNSPAVKTDCKMEVLWLAENVNTRQWQLIFLTDLDCEQSLIFSLQSYCTSETQAREPRLVPIPCCNITSSFAIAPAEIRTRLISREKAACQQSKLHVYKLWKDNFVSLPLFTVLLIYWICVKHQIFFHSHVLPKCN